MKSSKIRGVWGIPRLATTAFVWMIAACAAEVRPPQSPVFFPAPPELPRIQYLTSFSGLRDIEQQSAFDRFVLGARPDLKVNKPYGVAIHEGKIYVCDTNATVFVFDLEKRTFLPLEGAVGPGALRQPTNISIDRDGTKYVADPVRGQVVVYGADDKYLTAFGVPRDWRPVDAVPFESRLYVADPAKHVVHVLDRGTGQHLKTIGDKGDASERLQGPTNLAFDAEGYLYVTDYSRFQVLVYDRDGHFKAAIGRVGADFGQFARPKGIALDREGHLFVVDASFNNVQIFNKEGRLLLFFGKGGDRPGDLTLPAKVTIDYDNLKYFERFSQPGFRIDYLALVTSQFGERRINVFAYGHEEGKSYPTDAEALELLEERKQKESSSPP